jgi:phage terminase small subunit
VFILTIFGVRVKYFNLCLTLYLLSTNNKPMIATAQPILTPRQKAFVDSYIVCRNGAESARKAGYSARSANRQAAENMSKPAIKQAIEEGLKRTNALNGIGEERIKAFWSNILEDEEEKTENKIKVSELAAKFNGMFKDATSVGQPLFATLNITSPLTYKQLPVSVDKPHTIDIKLDNQKEISTADGQGHTPQPPVVDSNIEANKIPEQNQSM